MSVKQCTLRNSFTLKGRGLHTGKEVTISCKPAPENFGYQFKRTDLDSNGLLIPALAEFVTITPRSTILEKNEVKIQTIEHLLSALYGLQIDNCLIETDAEELPILDGSSKPFVEAIEKAGIEKQEEERKYFIVEKPYNFKDEKSGSEISLLPDNDFKIDVHLAYDSPFLKNQYAFLHNLNDYKEEIAKCRTFVFFRELEDLLGNGLVKGGELKNALVILDRQVSQSEIDRIANLFGHESQTVNELGIVNDIRPFFHNEPARHKLLDVIGDIALSGVFIKGRIIANRPGHHVNTGLALMIRKIIRRSNKLAPPYNPDVPPLMGVKEIKKLLPHRPPFLFVDKILSIAPKCVIGLKNVTLDEPFFVGHFPDESVMPGVLIAEAMAQCGGILILNNLDEPHKYSTYFVKINNLKFRKKVVPGDTLIFKLELISEFKHGMAHMKIIF